MTRPTALAVFDIDDTLTRTNAVGDLCYLAAHAEVLGVETLEFDWREFTHMTDRCINREIFERVRGRPPSSAEIAAVQNGTLARLHAKFDEDPSHFDPVPGAAAAIDHIVEALGWAVAFASGGWGETARYKLGRIGIDAAAWPGAYGDEFESREEIVQAAIERAATAHGVERFARIVALGDGVWDVTTARNLELAFIGIGAGKYASALRQAGARHVIADYRDLDGFVSLLDRAEVP